MKFTARLLPFFIYAVGLIFSAEISFAQSDAGAYIRYAIYLQKNNKPDSGILYASHALTLDPSSRDAYLVRARCYYDKGDNNNAITDYTMVIGIDPECDTAYYYRGASSHNKGDYVKAFRDYSKAIAINRDYMGPWYSRGIAWYAVDSFNYALSDLTQALKLNPAYSNSYYNRGLVYEKLGKNDSALADYSRAIQLSPGDPYAYIGRGLLYDQRGNSELALADYNKAFQIPEGAGFPILYNDRALVYKNTGRYELALKDLYTCLRMDSVEKHALLNIIPCLAREERFEEAASFYARYKNNRLNGYINAPEWEYYRLYLDAVTVSVPGGLYTEALSRLQESETQFKKFSATAKATTAESKNSYTDVLALKGYVLQKLNRGEEARTAWNQALVINPRQPDLMMALEKLKQFRGGEVQTIQRDKGNSLETGPKYHAILIAEQKYADPSIPSLQKPVTDAMNLKHLLETRYTFAPGNIDTLFNRNREDLLGAIIQKCNTLKSDDNLLIFYSGHGTAEKDQFGNTIGYLIPSSARKGNPFTYISVNDLVTALGRGNTRHILFIADACFSGALLREIAADAPKDARLAYAGISRKVMSSGNLEPVPDNSIFLYYLLKRLAENTEKYMTADDLFHRFKEAVINNSDNLPQFGTIKNTGDEGGDFVFIRK